MYRSKNERRGLETQNWDVDKQWWTTQESRFFRMGEKILQYLIYNNFQILSRWLELFQTKTTFTLIFEKQSDFLNSHFVLASSTPTSPPSHTHFPWVCLCLTFQVSSSLLCLLSSILPGSVKPLLMFNPGPGESSYFTLFKWIIELRIICTIPTLPMHCRTMFYPSLNHSYSAENLPLVDAQ